LFTATIHVHPDQPKELLMLSILSKFTCSHCDKFTLYHGHKLTDHTGKVISRICKPCSVEDDAAWAEYWSIQAQQEADADHLADLLADFCPEYGCYVKTYHGDKCLVHDMPCHRCGSDPCACVNDDPVQDDHDEQDYCDGCGNYGNGCVCAELASLARHNADPATRGSWWVA
jgi:hypothetical protein